MPQDVDPWRLRLPGVATFRAMLISVRWIDTCGNEGWCSSAEAEASSPIVVETFGHYVKEDERALTLAFSATVSGNAVPWGNLLTIPWESVIEWHKIEVS